MLLSNFCGLSHLYIPDGVATNQLGAAILKAERNAKEQRSKEDSPVIVSLYLFGRYTDDMVPIFVSDSEIASAETRADWQGHKYRVLIK